MNRVSNKKVIFIGGTSRSGSTLLDKIIANNKQAISLGEIHALFQPTRLHHFRLIQELLQNDKKWKKILKGGRKHLYPNLISLYPEIDIFVDSSKDPFWIYYHSKILRDLNIEVKNVLIFKKIDELADSFVKRNIYYKWAPFYIQYHKKYFSIIKEFYLISYYNLINTKSTLEDLCGYIKIPYTSEMRKYWCSESLTFFGSKTVEKKENKINLKYNPPALERSKKYIIEMTEKYPEIKEMESFLINNQDQFNLVPKELVYSKFYTCYFWLKRKIKIELKRIFPENIGN